MSHTYFTCEDLFSWMKILSPPVSAHQDICLIKQPDKTPAPTRLLYIITQ